jgi:maltose O-acetyltransferase
MFPIFGNLFKTLRSLCCKQIFAKCGANVNIERGVVFGCGFDLEIGNNSGIGINSVVPSDVTIGDNVLMGPKCFILSFNHAFKDRNKTIKEQGYSEKKKTIIGNDVWIGREVMFTPGRTVADGSVIAARTCLTKDFPSYSIVGGNPSRLIKYRE